MMASVIYSAREAVEKPASLVKKILSLVNQWLQNQRTRKQLADLPEYLLNDIGITKEKANQEVRRNFWD